MSDFDTIKMCKKHIDNLSPLRVKNHDEDMSYLERLLARLWAFVKGLGRIIPSIENHVSEYFNDAEIDDLENCLEVLHPQERDKERY